MLLFGASTTKQRLALILYVFSSCEAVVGLFSGSLVEAGLQTPGSPSLVSCPLDNMSKRQDDGDDEAERKKGGQESGSFVQNEQLLEVV